LEELLGELPSVELVTASTAEMGIDLVRAHERDAVIMDINLPG
jgi:DNA-binding NarL/FixJ family response regulator